MSGEVLTLQFGHYANFVGTHWWNVQERSFQYTKSDEQEVNHDTLYREGLNDKGQVTFTPRALIVDLKGSLGALQETSDLYDEIEEPSKVKVEWQQDKVEVEREKSVAKNKFLTDLETMGNISENSEYNLDNDVKVWSDFLYTRFHPRTVNIVKEYQHGTNTFSTFHSGKELWKQRAYDEDFADKIRNYIEECDHFQGCQILLDAVDGFSGLSVSCMEHLKDEYNRSCVAFPLIPSFYSDYNFDSDEERHQTLIKDSIRVLNLGFCFNSLKEFSSLFVPMCTGKNGWRQPGEPLQFYHSKYNPKLYYHSGAILASALDTISHSYRTKTNAYSLADLSSDFTRNGRIAAAASLCLPFSLNSDSNLMHCLDKWTGPLTRCITPNCTLGDTRMVQLYTLRGIPENRLKTIGVDKDLAAYRCKTIKEMLEFYLSCTTFTSINHAIVTHSGLCVKTPFPQIFDGFIGPTGNIIASSRPQDSRVQSVPVLAGLHNGTGLGELFESLHTELKRIKFKKFHQFKEAGVEHDDFVECLDSLFDFRECYEDNYHL